MAANREFPIRLQARPRNAHNTRVLRKITFVRFSKDRPGRFITGPLLNRTYRQRRTKSVHCLDPRNERAHRGLSGASVVSLSNPGIRAHTGTGLRGLPNRPSWIPKASLPKTAGWQLELSRVQEGVFMRKRQAGSLPGCEAAA
jgi:hypothetical protein